jgi:hypothetical protein
MVFALPPDIGQALPVVHRLLLPAPRAFLDEEAYAIFGRLHHASLEALRVTRPKAVGLPRNKRRYSSGRALC